MSGNALLSTKSVYKEYTGSYVLQDASVDIVQGKITALIGPNGAGKTTLFDILAGFVRATRGQVFFEEHDITHMPAFRRARRGLVKTFQIPHEFFSLTVEENLLVAGKGQIGERFPDVLWRFGGIAQEEKQLREQAGGILEFLDLVQVRKAVAGSLSSGQKKLLELARALMVQPKLLLLDEPLAGVPGDLSNRILEHLLTLRDQGMTLCVVEHNLEAVMRISDWIYVLVDGAMLSAGPPAEVQQDEKVHAAYLGV